VYASAVQQIVGANQEGVDLFSCKSSESSLDLPRVANVNETISIPIEDATALTSFVTESLRALFGFGQAPTT
jgi:hypothetical protein